MCSRNPLVLRHLGASKRKLCNRICQQIGQNSPQNGLFCLAKRLSLHPETAHIAMQNGLFCIAICAVSHCRPSFLPPGKAKSRIPISISSVFEVLKFRHGPHCPSDAPAHRLQAEARQGYAAAFHFLRNRRNILTATTCPIEI